MKRIFAFFMALHQGKSPAALLYGFSLPHLRDGGFYYTLFIMSLKSRCCQFLTEPMWPCIVQKDWFECEYLPHVATHTVPHWLIWMTPSSSCGKAAWWDDVVIQMTATRGKEAWGLSVSWSECPSPSFERTSSTRSEQDCPWHSGFFVLEQIEEL